MSKTPITDKLAKYLKVVEKVNFANTLDTGLSTSSAMQAWKQSGQDFDSALGLDNLKAGLGTDEAGVIDVIQKRVKNIDGPGMASHLFASNKLRGKKIDLLQVRQSSTQEQISPYIWSAIQYEPLVEDVQQNNPVPISNVNNAFWRIDPGSDLVFTKRPGAQFLPYFYTVAKSERLDALLHSKSGVMPAPGLESTRKLQSYVTEHCQEIIKEALETIAHLIPNDEQGLMALEFLNGATFAELPTVMADAITVGVADAANVCIHPDNNTISSENRVGWQVLNPTVALQSLHNNIMSDVIYSGDSSVLVEPVKLKIEQLLSEVENSTSVFDPEFILLLKKAAELRKFNSSKNSRSSKTTILFVVSQIVNQIKKVFGATIDSPEKEAAFYFGKLGLSHGGLQERVKEQKEFLGHALVNTTSPMVVLRGRAPQDGDNNVFIIDSHIVDIDITSGKRAFHLLNLKPIGLSSSVHYHVKHESVTNPELIGSQKEKYIQAFNKIQDSTDTIQGATYSRKYWDRILRTCYNGGNDFESGVFFVGLSPLFWDMPGGDTIYTSVDYGDLINKVELPYYVDDTDEYSTTDFYNISSASGVFFDRILYSNGSYGQKQCRSEIVIRQRMAKIINDPRYKFESLQEIRDKILTTLYNLDTSSEKDLREQATGVLYKVFKNVEAGFWTMSGKELKDKTLLACYNPWEYGEKTKRFRFVRENTTAAEIESGRARATTKYLKDNK